MFREDIENWVDKTTKDSINYSITWLGDSMLIIEGSKGIKSYDENTICVKTHNNYISVVGHQLKISEINDRDIIVRGIIKGVSLND